MDGTVNVPLARADELVVEELGDELLVYDLRSDHAHSLSSVAARVWRRCDGRTAAATVAEELGLDIAQVDRALAELAACELLAPGAHGGLSRRELTVRVAKGAMVAAGAPMIVSIVAPTPAAAQSPPAGCSGIGGCSGNCGQATGCKAVTVGCVCCQLDALNCEDHGVQRDSNIKFCAAGTETNCPPTNSMTHCLGDPCPNSAPASVEAQGSTSEPSPSTGVQAPPSTDVPAPPSTGGQPSPPAVPETPTAPPQTTPNTPAPTLPDPP